jgi:hypothetical protein
MGIVFSIFGKISEESPAHKIVKKTPSYEVREYAAAVAVETSYSSKQHLSSEGQGKPFGSLAGYIGVFKTPANERNEAISMTAPVSMQPQVPTSSEATAVAEGDNEEGAAPSSSYVMRFFLPASKYRSASEAPKPSSDNVRLVDVPPRTVAALTFSGAFQQDNIDEHTRLLLAALRKDGVQLASGAEGSIEVFGWNPPWTLSWLRTNEVLVPVVV